VECSDQRTPEYRLFWDGHSSGWFSRLTRCAPRAPLSFREQVAVVTPCSSLALPSVRAEKSVISGGNMSEKKTPRWLMETSAWTHDALVFICIAGIVLAVGILLFGGTNGTAGAGSVTP
jgi:hypothetical protein